MSQAEEKKALISDGKIVLLALVEGMVAFAITLFFISCGLVRHVDIFLPEKSYAITAFRNIDGELKKVGTSGIAGVNPLILMRTGDFAMELTVVNEESLLHTLYV